VIHNYQQISVLTTAHAMTDNRPWLHQNRRKSCAADQRSSSAPRQSDGSPNKHALDTKSTCHS